MKIMKRILFCLFTIVALNCVAQQFETTAVLDAEGNLVGIATKDDFLEAPFNEWFSFNYDNYEVNEDIAKELDPLLKDFTIKAFMGTWCSDSQDQTPVFYKILDGANFDYDNLELVTLNEDKKTPDNLQKGYHIERVPTFIFFKNGIEMGRFVEYPRETVEDDMLKIVSGEPYKHSYED
ncbi:MAG: thioredoxin family protein [Bacteroidetes bacterium]|nr:thioredoxin family protein [Bacteroidota bacterium]